MTNPTANEVNAKTAPKAATVATTTTAPPQDTDDAPVKGEHFRVLKAFTLGDGLTLMPGEEFNPADVAQWPERRTKQLVDQKYLRPIA